MTEDQKSIASILEILGASTAVPRTRDWVAEELWLAGRRPSDLPCIMELMAAQKLIRRQDNALGVARYTITSHGVKALQTL